MSDLYYFCRYPVWTFPDCVSYDMEKFIELGKTLRLEGAELLTFVEKQQELEREEKCREEEREKKRRREEEEKEERLRIEEEEKQERRRRQDEEREARRQEREIRRP